jgi:hypothetical protein
MSKCLICIVIADDFKSYNTLNKEEGYMRFVVNYSLREYAREAIPTNGIKSFWTLLERWCHYVLVKYIQSYINEFCFRANNNTSDGILNQSVLG